MTAPLVSQPPEYQVHPLGQSGLRPAPGLTVLLGAPRSYTVPGYLLRHDEALALTPAAPERVMTSSGFDPLPNWPSEPGYCDGLDAAARAEAIEAAVNAGWANSTAETVATGAVLNRLEELRSADIGCVVFNGRRAGRARRLARAARAPVLVLPDGAAPAGGPAVFDARDAPVVARPLAKCLATERAVILASYDPVPEGTLLRCAAHPMLEPELRTMARTHLKANAEAAHREAGRSRALTETQGLEVEAIPTSEPNEPLSTAVEQEGILVLADRGRRFGVPGLRAALRERRPVLLVPTGE